MLVSPISGGIGWAVVGYVVVIGVGRLLLTRDTIIDQLVNRALLWFLIGLMLYRCTPTPSVSSVTNQLALGCVVVLSMHLYGLARLGEAGADPEMTWRRQRVYCAVAVLSTVVTMLAGPFAGQGGRLVEHNLNWGGLVFWTANSAPLMAMTLVFSRLCMRELRMENPRPLVRALYVLMLLDFVPIYLDVVLCAGEMNLGWQLRYPHIVREEVAFVIIGGVATTLVAGPMVGHLMELAGLDRDGRICHRLRPLWRDVTGAVPEIVMYPAAGGLSRRDTTARLLRMTVEIRDALLHLGPYLAAMPPGAGPSVAHQDGSEVRLRDYACRLAEAARARRTGAVPPGSVVVPQPIPAAQDFDTELRQLLDLARVWPARTGTVPASAARVRARLSPAVGTVDSCALGD
ncbi:MAB_1171c family putative transporter [Nocardia sp. NPDC051052]|uniref:MAB_1171c family putative transporter n=1 Tax=Nocardia sp. NPDC051052 TaxID=3364322 RepID=UPI0037B5C6FC